MFCPISIDDYIRSHMENNPSDIKADVENAVRSATEAKKNGAKCMQCGQPIWAIGTAAVGWNGCFSCISGEADNSEDFEIDSVCFPLNLSNGFKEDRLNEAKEFAEFAIAHPINFEKGYEFNRDECYDDE